MLAEAKLKCGIKIILNFNSILYENIGCYKVVSWSAEPQVWTNVCLFFYSVVDITRITLIYNKHPELSLTGSNPSARNCSNYICFAVFADLLHTVY